MTAARLGPWAACLLVACGSAPGVEAVPTVKIERTRFQRLVEAEGHLKPVQATTVAAPRSPEGPLRISWLAEDGSQVKKGDVLARFDESELKNRLESARDDRQSAAAKIQKESLLVGQAKNERERTTRSAERELTMGRNFQRKDPQIYSREDIITSEIDATLQDARAEHARRAETVDQQIARRKLQILGVEAKKAEHAIARVESSLQAIELRAPHDGVLTLIRNWRGETIAPGDQAWGPLAEVSRSDELEAEVFVLESEAAGLASAKGKPAELGLDSLPGVVWKASIKRVEPIAKRRQFRSPTQYFGVTLTLARTDARAMKAGQRVRAKLLLDERDALVVPRPALFQKDGRWIVHRRRGGGFTEAPVTLGAGTAGLVVVESGLEPGDVVALRDPGLPPDRILSGPASPRKP